MTAAKTRRERFNIMLAEPADEGRVIALGPTFFTQPKLKGERCRVAWYGDEPRLFTSTGIEIPYMDHIISQLKESEIFQVNYDGELYVHGWTFNKIHSVVSRRTNKHPEAEKMELHIFDHQGTETQHHRLGFLQACKNNNYISGPLKLVPTSTDTIATWKDRLLDFVEDGYEGIILRERHASHILRRTASMLKFKPTHSDTYLITGAIEGVGWASGMLGSFLVRGSDGTEFAVGTGPALTKKTRAELWENRRDLPGHLLEVKHELTKTINQIPECTVAVRVHDGPEET